MDIQWEEPPAEVVERSGANSGGHYIEFAIELRKNQGKWALMPPPKVGAKRTDNSGKALAQNIRRGKVKGFDRNEYEAVSSDGKVWVRYTGPKGRPTTQGPKEPEDLARRARAWARDQGMNVSERGNLPRNIIEAYCKHEGIPVPGQLSAVK